MGQGGRKKLTRVSLFSYLATKLPPSASIAAIALADALETVICKFGVLKCSDPYFSKPKSDERRPIKLRTTKRTSPRSLTPSFTPCTHLVSYNSLIVIGFVGSINPLSIQCCSRSKFSGVICCRRLEFQTRRCQLQLQEGGDQKHTGS